MLDPQDAIRAMNAEPLIDEDGDGMECMRGIVYAIPSIALIVMLAFWVFG